MVVRVVSFAKRYRIGDLLSDFLWVIFSLLLDFVFWFTAGMVLAPILTELLKYLLKNSGV